MIVSVEKCAIEAYVGVCLNRPMERLVDGWVYVTQLAAVERAVPSYW
jgi:hypothetical protein